jgi:microcystin-dependent protein
MMKFLLTGAAGLALVTGANASAQSTFVGQVELIAGSYCPRDTAEAVGQLLSISQNSMLFALIGTRYGGNGYTTFALPDLQGRTAIDYATGPVLPAYWHGEEAGRFVATLTTDELPPHTHTYSGSLSSPDTTSLINAAPANYGSFPAYALAGAATVQMATDSIGTAGASDPMPIRGPGLAIRHCIALYGVWPSRN